jgi:ABC-type transporter Mla maintaining outer membrane lipid asymmetry permease subunit MlaE
MSNAEEAKEQPASLSFFGYIQSLLQTLGGTALGFFAAVGRLSQFTGNSIRHCFTPPFFPRLLLRQLIDIGYYSLPVVGLTTLFTGMVLAPLPPLSSFLLRANCRRFWRA